MIRDPSDGSVTGKKRPSVKALKAKHGDNWGISPPPIVASTKPQAPTADQLRAHYAKHNLAFEPKEDRTTLMGEQGE